LASARALSKFFSSKVVCSITQHAHFVCRKASCNWSAGWLGMFMGSRPVATPQLLRGLATEGVRAVDVAAGHHHSLVATQDRGCWVFGSNQWWQLGLPEPSNRMEPTQVHSRRWQRLASISHYRSLAKYHTLSQRLRGKSLEIAEQCQTFSPQMICPSGSIFRFPRLRYLARPLQRPRHVKCNVKWMQRDCFG
jgi:hypothetical protein